MARTLSSKSKDAEAEAGAGHNSGAIDAAALKRYVERAAAIMEEQKELADDLAEVCKEADEAGVTTKRELRRLARESLMDQEVLQAQLERMDVLRHALGSFAATPLGEAAVKETGRKPAKEKENPWALKAVAAAREHLGTDSDWEPEPPLAA